MAIKVIGFDSLDKNRGKKAIKNIIDLGFERHIASDCLNVFKFLLFCLSFNKSFSCVKNIFFNPKKNKYIAPVYCNILKIVGNDLSNVESPSTADNIYKKSPERMPHTAIIPDFIPLLAVDDNMAIVPAPGII